VVSHSFPSLLTEDPARAVFDEAKAAFAESDAVRTIDAARRAQALQPNYLPAHMYEELGLNISRSRDLGACARKCIDIIELGQRLIKGQAEAPLTVRPVQPEHINEMLDMARYNLSDRYMRLGNYQEALDQLLLSEMLPKSTEAKLKRKLKEASLLFRLRDKEGSRIKLKQARDMDRELFMLLRERMAFDGHAGVDQPI
jgi:tetratricopeptide (TPR) repeat protein